MCCVALWLGYWSDTPSTNPNLKYSATVPEEEEDGLPKEEEDGLSSSYNG
jgi:hypothetical protein